MIVGHIGSDSSGGYEIQKSLRFRASASAYLSRTFASNGVSRNKCTISMWCKRGTLGVAQRLVDSYDGGSAYSSVVLFTADNKLNIDFGGSSQFPLITSRVFRDPSAHFHVHIAIDSTLATVADRVIVSINGIRETSFSTANYPSQNANFQFAVTGGNNKIGSQWGGASSLFDGYLSEINFIDGQALDPSYFGEVSAETGAWIPKKYAGTYGTNGFYLPFNDGSSLANLTADRSGNGNNWTANNTSLTAGATYDWMDDTPSNNFAVLNPLNKYASNIAVADGNLGISTSAVNVGVAGTIGVSSGKWYWETTFTNANGVPSVGAAPATWNKTYAGEGTGGVGYHGNGNIYNAGTSVQSGLASYTSGDVISVALDLTAGSITFYKNNVQQGTTVTGLTGEWFPAISGQTSSILVANFGQRPFAYAPPAGFKALCTKNLPAPSILNPKKHFDVVLATGANIKTTAEAVFPSNFLEWIKDRGNVNNHQLIDVVRGTSAVLQSNTTAAETTYVAPSGSSVAWLWKAGGAAVTNTDGTITSQVSANREAGFSIVTGTMANGGGSFGHGLVALPSLIISKRRAVADDWFAWYKTLANPTQSYLVINSTNAQTTHVSIWNGNAPTSTVFSLGTSFANNGDAFVSYCFAEIPGYSKIDSYVGNGSADGPFVYCGFRPRFVLIKRVDAADSWFIFDSVRNIYNALDLFLCPNMSQAEAGAGTPWLDLTSNGFKVRSTSPAFNTSGGTYIFAAFAEQPFQFANAR